MPMYVRRSFVVYYTLVQLVLCFVVLASHADNGYRPFYLRMNNPAYVLYSPEEIGSSGLSQFAANAYCMNNGMNIFSAETPDITNNFYTDAVKKFGTADYYSYVATSADPSGYITSCAKVRTPGTSFPDPFFCFFSFRFGLLTIWTTLGTTDQPGIGQYQGIYGADSPSGVTKGVQMRLGYDINWINASHPCGHYYAMVTGSGTQAAYLNVEATLPTDGINIDSSKVVIYCESQNYINAEPITSAFFQPAFVKGYKDWTWPQKNWWVIFLIAAGVILAVLFSILIFCCSTAAPPKADPPIAPMVLRERNGRAYVNASDGEASSKMFPRETLEQPIMMGPQYPATMMVDPEDLIQATPAIYAREEKLQVADGDSIASDMEDDFDA